MIAAIVDAEQVSSHRIHNVIINSGALQASETNLGEFVILGR
jgi:hypothetical protein